MKNIFLLLLLCMGGHLLLAQSITNVTPSQNPVNEGSSLTVTISGNNTNFAQGSNTYVYAYVNGNYVYGYTNTVFNNNSMSATLYLPCGACGTGTVYVQNPIDGTLSYGNAFNVNCSQLTGISTNTANAGQSLPITLSGTNMGFAQGSNSVYFYNPSSGQTLYPSSYNSSTNSTLNISLNIPIYSCSGTFSVCATNSNGCTECLPNALTVVSTNNPEINSVTPGTANIGQNLTVSISGTDVDFTQGSNIYYYLSNGNNYIYGYNSNPSSPTQTNVSFSLPNNCGSYDLLVYGASSCGSPLVYNNAVSIGSSLHPRINTVSPTVANAGQALTVSLSGSDINFLQATNLNIQLQKAGSGGQPIYGYNLTPNFSNPTQATVDFHPSVTHSGVYDLVIYNVQGGCNSTVLYRQAITIEADPTITTSSTNSTTYSPFIPANFGNPLKPEGEQDPTTVSATVLEEFLVDEKEPDNVDNDGSTTTENTVSNPTKQAGQLTNLNSAIELNVYPNPMQDQATIAVSGAEDQVLTFQLYDMLGHQLMTKTIRNNEKAQLNRQNLSTGIYIYRLFAEDGSALKVGKLKIQ